MPAVIVLTGVAVATVIAVLTWRWIQVYERVAVARARAGGDERAKKVAQLQADVDKLKRYMTGEDTIKEGVN